MTPDEAIQELGLVVTSEFVPWSQSRNKNEETLSLNWRVTLKRMAKIDGAYKPGSERTILTTDYMAGISHCPSYRRRMTAKDWDCVDAECETGLAHHIGWGERAAPLKPHKTILPKPTDVIYSLLSDASAIDSGGFENWAAELEYDTDSRKAEAIYRQCVDIGLRLRYALGDDGLRKLQKSFQEY